MIKCQSLLVSTSICLNLSFSSVTLNVEMLLCIPVVEKSLLKAHIAENTEVSPNFLVWKFCENALFPQSFHKIFTQRNLVKFRYFMQWEKQMTMRFQHCVKSVQIRSFFWSVFSCIRTEYGDLLRKSPYSVRIQENTDQKKLHIWTLFMQCMTT